MARGSIVRPSTTASGLTKKGLEREQISLRWLDEAQLLAGLNAARSLALDHVAVNEVADHLGVVRDAALAEHRWCEGMADFDRGGCAEV